MAGVSISPPGVTVNQTIATTSPTVAAPLLQTVIVAPCFQNVSAYSDLGAPQIEAFAGTYRDGLGTVAYSLPSLLAQASLSGFESSVRTFLEYGGTTRELNSVFNEISVVSAGAASYTNATRKLVDPSQLFTQIGVVVGDVVRITWRNEVMDIAVSSVDSDTTLTLAVSALAEDLASVTYDVVRNPAEFIFNATQQANAEIGLDADYIRFIAASLKVDGVTVADYVGAAGDALSVSITDSERFVAGGDGATGSCIFKSATGTFITSVGARGSIGTKWLAVGALGDGDALRDIIHVVSNTLMVIEPGEATGLTAQAFRVLSEISAGSGSTDGTGNTFTGGAGETFTTSIPNTAGTPNTPTLVELSGVGTYVVTAVVSDTVLTIAGTAAAASLVGQAYVVAADSATASDGATGALTDFVSISADFTTLVSPTTKSINIAGLEAHAIATVVDADQVTLSTGAASSGSGLSFSAVSTSSDLTLSWDLSTTTVVIQLARAAGMSSSTYAEINAAITTPANPAYNVAVASVVTSLLGGTVGTGAVALTQLDVGTSLQLDGGSNAEQLLLDADLLASSTPTAQVYVSYKALRLDVTASAADPILIDVSSVGAIDALVGPPSVDNPLALALKLALQNSPTRSIKALGVSGVSATKPNGTAAAYTEAFSFLEGYPVHLIAPMTDDLTIAELLSTHVTAMSQPNQKSERTGYFSSPLPSHKKATAVASGASGNSGVFQGNAVAEFSASTDFAAAGVVAGDILVVGALADLADSPAPVLGTVGPLHGVLVSQVKAGDSFVLELDGSAAGISSAWDSLIDVSFTVYRSGVAITQSVDMAEAIALTSESFASRRMFHHWPDSATIDLAGLATIIPGFYVMAGWAGKANGLPARQGFSKTSLVGYLTVKHSNGLFNNAELDRIAGGGTWITTQSTPNSRPTCRHQLSTDTSAVEKREASITRALDYATWYLRAGLNKQTGSFNITQSYLDALATATQGLLRALVESGTLTSASLVSLSVNALLPDVIDIVIAVSVPYPANYLEITLQV